MSTAEVLAVTFDDYLALEERDERRHEWVAGHVYAMAGGTERHDNLAEVAYYPDLLVVCRDALPPDRLFERDLSLVVEVLSPSTEKVDRREKALVYSSAPSFERYLLADPDRRRIEVATPGPAGLRWTSYGPGEEVPYVDLDVDALYDQLDAVTATPR